MNVKKYFQGKLSRKPYLIKTIYILLIVSVIGGVLAAVFGNDVFFNEIMPILMFLGIIFVIPITTQRLHDIGYSGWLALLMVLIGWLFPTVGVVFGLSLFVWPSKIKNQKENSDNRQNINNGTVSILNGVDIKNYRWIKIILIGVSIVLVIILQRMGGTTMFLGDFIAQTIGRLLALGTFSFVSSVLLAWAFKINKEKLKLAFAIILFLSTLLSFFGTILLKVRTNQTINRIEKKEGKSISGVLDMRLAEFDNLKQIIESSGLKDEIEKQENRHLEEIPIERLKQIVAGIQLKNSVPPSSSSSKNTLAPSSLPVIETEPTVIVIPAKAFGKVTAYNDGSNPQVLVKNTRFVTPDGKIFRLSKIATIPAGGSIEVVIFADETGSVYNIPPTTFKMPAFVGSERYGYLYGRSFVSMEGGK